ncbi:hypothetical protein [Comamonas antarctica]|uniref:Uncharacterized protein n=1 Tax=Comamonas antarctica TaxID=2743470 RepID=A0A6N1X5I9_9BURK|nr:hypothetical protein [Comamonas antarctica]QKV54729.1 hypothetical protein HUK68_18530 [Comamonas antarctica]
MSGSSGGGGGSIVDDDQIACHLLKFETRITSPNAVVLVMLSVGKQLNIQIAAGSTAQEIQVVTSEGQIVGGLLHNKAQRLRECLLAQTSYKATVRSINNGQVDVFVEPV